MRRPIRYVLVAALATMACDSNPLAPSEVVGPAWQLVSLQEEGSNPITVRDPSRYTLRFEEGGRVAVLSDCNSCGGSYSLSESSLDVHSLACTKVFCGDTSLDQVYARALEGAQTVSLSDSELTIRGEGATLGFRR